MDKKKINKVCEEIRQEKMKKIKLDFEKAGMYYALGKMGDKNIELLIEICANYYIQGLNDGINSTLKEVNK